MKIIFFFIIQVLVFTGCTRKSGLENSEYFDVPGNIISKNTEIINNSIIIQEENIYEKALLKNQINDADLNNILGIDFTIINLNENKFYVLLPISIDRIMITYLAKFQKGSSP